MERSVGHRRGCVDDRLVEDALVTVVAGSPRRASIGPLAWLPLPSMSPPKTRSLAIGVTMFVLPRTNACGVFDTSRVAACQRRLLSESPVPVAAMKLREEEDS
jgi:hypothetical protein